MDQQLELRASVRKTGIPAQPRHAVAQNVQPCPKWEMVGATGFEPVEPSIRHQRLTTHDTPQDTPALQFEDLALIVAAWPRLSREVRTGITAMVRAVVQGREDAR